MMETAKSVVLLIALLTILVGGIQLVWHIGKSFFMKERNPNKWDY